MRDTIKEIVNDMASSPRFISDNWQGVANTMSKLGQIKSEDGIHYPLIVLDSNYSDELGNQLGVGETVTAKLYFINETDINYTPSQRDELSYDANIIPLMNEFLFFALRSTKLIFDIEPFPKAFKNSLGVYKVFMPTKTNKLPFLKGKGATQNKLNAKVDVLELEIELKTRK